MAMLLNYPKEWCLALSDFRSDDLDFSLDKFNKYEHYRPQ